MVVPVTVIGSTVAAPCPLPFELVCANATGTMSAKARVTIILFIMPPSWVLMVMLGLDRFIHLLFIFASFQSLCALMLSEALEEAIWLPLRGLLAISGKGE